MLENIISPIFKVKVLVKTKGQKVKMTKNLIFEAEGHHHSDYFEAGGLQLSRKYPYAHFQGQGRVKI